MVPEVAARRPLRPSGALLVVAAAVLWGTLGVVFQLLGRAGASPVAIGFWRAALAAGAIFAWLAVRDRRALAVAARDLGFFAAYGLVSVAVFFCVYPLAVHLTTVAVAVVLLYTAPAWVAAMGALFLGEPFGPRKAAALALAFTGTCLVAGAYDPQTLRGSLPGLAAGLASGFTYATLSIFGRKAPPRYGTPTVMLYTLGLGALFLAWPATRDPAGFQAPVASSGALALTLYAGLVPTAGSFLLYTAGLRLLGDAGRASLLATVEPPVAAVLGLVVLGEGLSAPQVVGGLLVLAGVVVLQAAGDGPTPPRGAPS